MRRMWDAAYPPSSPPHWEAVAGYIGGNTPHVWTDAEWARQQARWRLPIFTRSLGGDPVADARAAVAWLRRHRVPKGATLALDFETRVDRAYLRAFDREIVKAGYRTMVYGSRHYVMRNPKPSGGYWTATWNNVPHLDPGAAATQYGGDVTLGRPYDASLVADSTPLWDTKGEKDMPLSNTDLQNVREQVDAALTAAFARRWDDTAWTMTELLGRSRGGAVAIKRNTDQILDALNPTTIAQAVAAELAKQGVKIDTTVIESAVHNAVRTLVWKAS